MKVRNYMRLYKAFVKNSIIAQMEYRVNFILSILTECGFLLAKSLYIIVIFAAGVPIYGISPEKMLLFIGSYILITGIMNAVLYPNIAMIPTSIRNGDLDVHLVNPDSLMELVWAMWDFNNMPMTIYNRTICLIGVFVIPIFVITNFPPMYVLGILPLSYMIYAMIATPVFFLIAILFWNFAIRKYSSASC